jgi:hypothetical protein
MSDGKKKSLDPSVLAAIITVAGGIIVTLISTFASRSGAQPDPTVVPTWTTVPTVTQANTPAPTDTVVAGESTSTPVPDTPTPEPTFTPTPPPIGADWANNCISALWQAVPISIQTEQENGCLKQPVGDFSATDGRFSFLVNRRFGGGEIYGVFAPLDSEGTVSLKVHLDALEKGDVWMGVFAEPSTDSTGVIMYVPSGDVTKRLLVMQPLPGNNKSQTQIFNQSSATYDVSFKYAIGTVQVSAMNNGVVFNPVPVTSAQKWLFIGFRTANGNNAIGAQFYDLVIE